MKFLYTAYDKQGRPVSAATEAASLSAAKDLLRAQGLFATELREDPAEAVQVAALSREQRGEGRKPGTGERLKFLATFARQLNVLVSTGTPIVQGLSAIERQTEQPRWRRVVAQVREQVEAGVPLSQTMQHFPHYFDAVSRSLIAAGETSGSLSTMLGRLATLARKQSQLRSSIIGALVYPSLLMVMGIGVVILMLLFVLPRFSGLFETLDSPLPPTTKFLLYVSTLLRSFWWAALLVCTATGAGIKYWLGSSHGKAVLCSFALRAPKVGALVRSLVTARITRLLGVLIESRVPLLEALGLTRNAAGHPAYARLMTAAEEAVTRGEPISAVFGGTDLINPSVQEAVRNGEQTGKLGEPLVQMADFLDEENEVIVKALTSLLEPLILIALGVVVGLMALSMFLPLFDLVSAASGGAK